MVGRAPLSGSQVGAVRAFAGARAFDLVHVPGIAPDEANRFNVLDRPYFHEAAQRLLGGAREAFVRDYKFDIRPATDDRPYFWSFFRWAQRSRGPSVSAARAGSGCSTSATSPCPPRWSRRWRRAQRSSCCRCLPCAGERGGARRWPALGGFFCIGLAFLLIEIAFIGRFTIILSHPVHALGVVVLAAFLLFAGAGSYLSARRGAGASITGPVIGIAVIATTCALTSPWLTGALIGAPPAVKVAAAFALIAPLATLMGMPFPRALARLNAVDPSLLPWAWGINGCASVIGAVLATLLGIHFGHTAVTLAGVVLYLVAAAAVSRMAPGHL